MYGSSNFKLDLEEKGGTGFVWRCGWVGLRRVDDETFYGFSIP
jgi:hypothetical protein